jgi:hypothetical protein
MVPIRRPDGQVVNVPMSMVRAMQANQAARAAGEEGQEPQDPADLLDPEDLKKAVVFIEAAFRNSTPPEVFAASARNMVPAPILAVLKAKGVDNFLNTVAQLEDGSPLASVAGRIWVRKVATFLLEGTTEGVADEESPVESS